DEEFALLPADSPSRRAAEVLSKAFPEDQTSSSIVLVLNRGETKSGQLDRDLKFIEDVVEPGLRQIAKADGGLANEAAASDEPLFGEDSDTSAKPTKRSLMARIRTPNAPGLGALLDSADHSALLLLRDLTPD